jgi:hypothetical protein
VSFDSTLRRKGRRRSNHSNAPNAHAVVVKLNHWGTVFSARFAFRVRRFFIGSSRFYIEQPLTNSIKSLEGVAFIG